jgi:hypothetical protein
MELIPIDELRRFATHRCEDSNDACVTVTMPTHRESHQHQQDQIRFKNLLDGAAELLEAEGFARTDIKALLDPAREDLQEDIDFWQNQLDGLCVFRSKDFLYAYRLPYAFKELVVVGPRFHIKPLLPILSGDGQYYLIALTQDEIDVYVGTRYELTELNLSDLPEDLWDLLIPKGGGRIQQWHTGTQASGGHPSARARPAAFHGHGAVGQQTEDDILKLYHKVDEVITPDLGDEEIPLLLAGGDDLIALYEEANTYPYLVDDAAIRMNPAGLSHEELHERAWEILGPRFTEDRAEAQQTYEMLAAKGSTRASDDLKEIVSAAYFERVALLFVARDREIWGSFDSETNDLRVDETSTAQNEDLLDLATLHTIFNGGMVYVVDADEMPAESSTAAVFRY